MLSHSSELDMAAKQCMQITNKPRKKRESLLCERRGDGPTEARGSDGDGSCDGAGSSPRRCRRRSDRERLRVRERARLLVREETESERERLFELSFFFLVCCYGFNFCVPEAAGDGVTGRDWDWERARERGDWEWEGETESLNFVFFFWTLVFKLWCASDSSAMVDTWWEF